MSERETLNWLASHVETTVKSGCLLGFFGNNLGPP